MVDGREKTMALRVIIISRARSFRRLVADSGRIRCSLECKINAKPATSGVNPKKLSAVAPALLGCKTHMTRMTERPSRIRPVEVTIKALLRS
jgi:hypothetical protein